MRNYPLGDAATETAIVKKMPQARIIHLATYTLPNNCVEENSPGVIALASSERDDGWLKTEEIQNLNLKADLVVLSSCDTALGKITGDGVSPFGEVKSQKSKVKSHWAFSCFFRCWCG